MSFIARENFFGHDVGVRSMLAKTFEIPLRIAKPIGVIGANSIQERRDAANPGSDDEYQERRALVLRARLSMC